MMQAVLPPAAVQCEKASDAARVGVKSYLVVSGDPAQLEEWSKEAKQRGRWKVSADTHANGVRTIRLSADASMPYRDVGGLIYSAQARRLSVAFQRVPPICETQE